jgi:glucose-6-phosphate 1-dehydrogenase
MVGEKIINNPLREGLFSDRVPVPCTLVIFGASGDLTQRKLVPALFDLYRRHQLPASFNLVGISRSKLGDEEFRKHLKDFLKETDPGLSDALFDSFSQNFHYLAGGYDDPATFKSMAQLLNQLDSKN